ncbi:MAG TPA: Ig-like domain-containing protein, partial [Armatimonadota bacterium]
MNRPWLTHLPRLLLAALILGLLPPPQARASDSDWSVSLTVTSKYLTEHPAPGIEPTSGPLQIGVVPDAGTDPYKQLGPEDRRFVPNVFESKPLVYSARFPTDTGYQGIPAGYGLQGDFQPPIVPGDPVRGVLLWPRVRAEMYNRYDSDTTIPTDTMTLTWSLTGVPTDHVALFLYHPTLLPPEGLDMRLTDHFTFQLPRAAVFPTYTDFQIRARDARDVQTPPPYLHIISRPYGGVIVSGQVFNFVAESGPVTAPGTNVVWQILTPAGSNPVPSDYLGEMKGLSGGQNLILTYKAPTIPAGGQPRQVKVRATQASGAASDEVVFTVAPDSVQIPTLSITDFDPSHGVAGIAVTIFGTGFELSALNNTVQFRGPAGTWLTAPIIGNPTNTQMNVQVPAGVVTGLITVTARGRQAYSPREFIVDAPTSGAASLNNRDPDSGAAPLLQSEVVELSQPGWDYAGTSLNTLATKLRVLAKGIPDGTVVSSISINGVESSAPDGPFPDLGYQRFEAYVPEGASTGQVRLMYKSGGYLGNPDLSDFRVFGKPSITDMRIATLGAGPVQYDLRGIPGISMIQIQGQNLGPDTESGSPGRSFAKFTGTPPVLLDSISQGFLGAPDTVSVTVPPGAQRGPVSVISQCQGTDGQYTTIGVATWPVDFIPVVNPHVVSFTPASGTVGDEVLISGSNFLPQGLDPSQVLVYFGGTDDAGRSIAPHLADPQGTWLKVHVPLWARNGVLTVRTPFGETSTTGLTNPLGQLVDSFTVLPSISALPLPDPIETSPTIAWTTKAPTDTYIELYGPYIGPGVSVPPGATPYGTFRASQDTPTTSHSLQLTGLNPNDYYVIRIVANRSRLEGGLPKADVATETLDLKAHTQPYTVQVFKPTVTPGLTDATVVWVTSPLSSKGSLWYGTDPSALTLTKSEPIETDVHSQALTGLKPDVTHYVQVRASATGARDGQSEVVSFHLLPNVQITSAPTTLKAGETFQFQAHISDPTPDVQLTWSVAGPALGPGTIDKGTGLYQAANPSEVLKQSVLVTVTAKLNNGATATKAFTLLPNPSFTLKADRTMARPGMVVNLSDNNDMVPNGTGIDWKLSSAVGSLAKVSTPTVSNVYTPPADLTTVRTISITATSTLAPTVSRSVSVELRPKVTLKLDYLPKGTSSVPPTLFLLKGETVTLSVSGTEGLSTPLSGTDLAKVAYDYSPDGGSTWVPLSGGIYTVTAPLPFAGIATVFRATLPADYNALATVELVLRPRPLLRLDPSVFAIHSDQSKVLQASVDLGTGWGLPPAALPLGFNLSAPTQGDLSVEGLKPAQVTLQPHLVTARTTLTVSVSAEGAAPATATGSIYPPLAVVITPPTDPIQAGGAPVTFAATVQNPISDAEKGVTWSVALLPGATGDPGKIDSATGVYTPPASVPSTASVIVTATSTADPTKSATATVGIDVGVFLVDPPTLQIVAGDAHQFRLAPAPPEGVKVSWYVDWLQSAPGDFLGTIDATTGLYRAPAQPPTSGGLEYSVFVQATYTVGTVSQNATPATVRVVPKMTVSITPPTGITTISAKVTWMTNVSATGVLSYWSGAQPTPQQVALTLPQMAQSTLLTNLKPHTAYSLQVEATSDAASLSQKATSAVATLTTLNSSPVLGYLPDSKVPDGTPVSFTLTATDADGDVPRYSASGTLPAGARLDPVTGAFAWTPTPDQARTAPYVLTFIADDGFGGTDIKTVSITVTPSNKPPVAQDVSASTPQNTPVQVLLRATDPEGAALSYAVVKAPTLGSFGLTGNQLTYTPNKDAEGTDTFTYKANDGRLDSNIATVTVTITHVNRPPTATPQTLTTLEDTPLAVVLAGTDPDGDSLTSTVATQPAHGTLSGAAPNLTYTPAANYNGPDSFTFTVSDGKLTSTPATVSITVTPVNDPPVLTVPTAQTVDEGKPLSFTVSATDPDAGDTVTLSATGLPKGASFTPGSGAFAWTPGFDQAGDYTVGFTADDGKGGRDSKSVSIHVVDVNRPPVATPQPNVTTAEDTPKAITLTGTDPDGDALTYAVATQPKHGTLSGTAPALTYTPAANYDGSDSFTFTVSDGKLTSDPATVTLTVTPVNDPPTISKVADQTLPEDTASNPLPFQVGDVETPAADLKVTVASDNPTLVPPLYVVLEGSGANRTVTVTPAKGQFGKATLTLTVTDADGGTASSSFVVTVSAVNHAPIATPQTVTTAEDTPKAVTLSGTDQDPGDTLTFSVTAQPAHGTLSGTAPALTYTPAKDFNGSDSFSFTVSDGKVTSAPAAVSITVTPVNDPPVAADQAVTTSEDTPVKVDLKATDVDGDKLTYSLVTQPSHGKLSALSGSSVTYTPDANYNGTDSFTWQASDGQLPSNTAAVTLTVTPVNDKPVLTVTGPTTVKEGEAIQLKASATDVDGDTVTLSVSPIPGFGKFDASSGTLDLTPTYPASLSSPFTLTFKADDGHGGTDTKQVSVTVTHVNSPPIANNLNKVVKQDTELTFSVSDLLAVASDPDGGTVSVTGVESSATTHGTVTLTGTGTAATVSFVPDAGYVGVASFLYVVIDGQGGTAKGLVTVNVQEDTTQPPPALAETPWPMFRHDPQHTGRSIYAGPVEPAVAWQQPLPALYASPAVGIDRTLYVNSRGQALAALKPDGTQVWNYGSADWVRSSPAIASDGTIYVGIPGGGASQLVALTPSAELRWSLPLSGDVSSSPAIGHDGTVYIGSGDRLNAVSPDGTLKWFYRTSSLVISSPALSHDEKTVYIGSDDGYLYAVDSQGNLSWRYETPLGGVRSSPTVGQDGTVYVGSTNGSFYAVQPTGTLRWKVDMGGVVATSPAVAGDGTVYIGSDTGDMVALDTEGTVLWRYSTGQAITGSPAIDKDGVVYIGSGRVLHAI